MKRRSVKSEGAESTASDAMFLPLSQAAAMLTKGMFGGYPQPEPVYKVKQRYQKAPVGFGPWKEYAQQRIRAAAVLGRLPVYVNGRSNRAPLLVPPKVIARFMVLRGGLPDHPIRPTLKSTGGDEHLLHMLKIGTLVVCENEFASWYKVERRRNRWPSQHSSTKKRGAGRPTKRTALRGAVAAVLRQRGRISVATLRRILIDSGRTDVPSADTLARLVDQLHRETGDAHFFRAKRRPRRRT